jgi:hypothetical protein
MIQPETGPPKAPERAMALIKAATILARYLPGYQKVR